MDLIYTNKNKEDQGILLAYELDLAFGKDENNFECKIEAADHCMEAGSLLYIEGTEYGGIVDTIFSDTGNHEVTYCGRTWHGILSSKVILPLQEGEGSTASVTVKTNEDERVYDKEAQEWYYPSLVNKYLIISGDLNDCIHFILERCGLGDLFVGSETASGITVTEYQFARYTDTYTGLMKLLDSVGYKLHTRVSDGVVVLSAKPKHDYSKDEEFDSRLIDLQITKKYHAVNHLICLGSGELENRMVIHLYADEEGNISQKNPRTGLKDIVDIYDYPNVESEAELIRQGTDQLKSLWEPDELEVNFISDADSYDIGDTVGAVDDVTGISAATEITKKIVTIKNGQINISYKVGDI